MEHCKTCSNAIFDPLWGDYKCKAYQIVVHPDQKLDCELYKKGKPGVSKDVAPN